MEPSPICEGIPLCGDPLCLLGSVGHTCSPKPTANRPGGCSPVPLKQIKNCFHWIVTEFPWLSSSPFPGESRPGPGQTGSFSMTCLPPLQHMAQLRSSKLWNNPERKEFWSLWGHPLQQIEDRTARAPCMPEEPMQLPPLLLSALEEARLEDKEPKRVWGKIRVQSRWLRDGWKIGTSACRHSWDQVRTNTGFVASCEMTPASAAQWRAVPSKSTRTSGYLGCLTLQARNFTAQSNFLGLFYTFLEDKDVTYRADELMKNNKKTPKK